MSGHRVADGTQVNVDGVVYGSGETLPELRDGQADLWRSVGWIVPIEDRPRPAARRKAADK